MPKAWRGILLSLLVAAAANTLAASDAEPALLQRDAEVARRRVDALVAFLDDKAGAERLARLFKDHGVAGAAAHAYIFDDKKYAVPAKAHTGWIPGKDTQPGYEEMERLVSAAVAKHNELLAALCQSMRAVPETCGDKQPTLKIWGDPVPKVPSYGIYSATALFDQFFKAFDREYKPYLKTRAALEAAKAAETPKTENRGLYKALAALAAGQYKEARTAGASLSGLEADFFREACAFHVFNWNAANPLGRTPAEAEATKILNLYRIALNLHPLVHSEKLQQVSKDYAQEMDRLNFFDHVHPRDPARKTMGLRGQRLGYPEICGECISSTGKGNNEIWEWRADAGHHRIMVDADDFEIGLGFTKKGVLNVGRGTQSAPSALFSGKDAGDTGGGIADRKTNPFGPGK
ncbi:MAG: CAP domain-containing protein [Planctomycetes bacterium]|nr:CAP domain-containing protein [Planctomycetota bacterium]